MRPAVVEATLVRRFARDRWVRLHGTPRVTVLAGGDRLRAMYQAWIELADPRAPAVVLRDDVDLAVREACARAVAQPAETVAILLAPERLRAWRAGRADRLAAMVDEGLIALAEPTAPRVPPAAIVTLDARSAAEAALFEALEATASTAGRFELNESLSVRFGPAAAEVDLLSRADRIAIEIDGAHHFESLDRYRRDRRKDLALQLAGLFVIRVLADDVLADPRDAIRAVNQALAYRRGPP